MGKRLPGMGRTYRDRLLSLPGVKLLASKRIRWFGSARSWRRCDLVEVKRKGRRTYWVTLSRRGPWTGTCSRCSTRCARGRTGQGDQG